MSEKIGEIIKEIVESNNKILELERNLRDLDKEKNSPLFELEEFLKEHYRITDLIGDYKAKLEELYIKLN